MCGVSQVERRHKEEKEKEMTDLQKQDLLGKPDVWKLTRPVWGWGQGAVPWSITDTPTRLRITARHFN